MLVFLLSWMIIMMARVFDVGVYVVLDDNHMMAKVFDVGVCCPG